MIEQEEQRLREYIEDHMKLSVFQLQCDPIAFEFATQLLQSSTLSSTDPYGVPFDQDSEEWFEMIELTLARKHLLIHNIDKIIKSTRTQQTDRSQYFEYLYTDVSINLAGTAAVVTFQPQRAAPIPPAFVYTPVVDDFLQAVSETYAVYFNKLLRRQRTEDHHNVVVTVTLRWMYKTDECRQIFDVVMYATK